MRKKESNGQGSTRQLSNGRWECIMQSKYENPDSASGGAKRIKRKGDTEEEARSNCKKALIQWEKQYESNKIEEGKFLKKKTFGEYMDEFVDEIVKPGVTASTYKSYVYTLQANFHNYKISRLQLHMLNVVEFEVFFDTLIKDKSQKTAAVPIQLNKRCCSWLYSRGLLTDDYASYAQTKKQKKDEFFREIEKDKGKRKETYSYEDIRKFYYAYKNGLSEYCPAIILILETFMRSQELVTLTLDDIDLEANIITIRSALGERFVDNDKTKGLEKYIKIPKNGEERVTYMTPLAREVVIYMMEQTRLKCRSNPQNLLFPSYLKHGKIRSLDAFEIQFKALCDKIGVDRDVRPTKLPNGLVVNKGLCLHALRHTAITIANTAPGANAINTALASGHKAISTQNIYTHANVEALKTIQTASSVALKDEKIVQFTDVRKSDEQREEELYEMFLKLKEIFGDDGKRRIL